MRRKKQFSSCILDETEERFQVLADSNNILCIRRVNYNERTLFIDYYKLQKLAYFQLLDRKISVE